MFDGASKRGCLIICYTLELTRVGRKLLWLQWTCRNLTIYVYVGPSWTTRHFGMWRRRKMDVESFSVSYTVTF